MPPNAPYPVRLGPLAFSSVVGDLTEALGDKLDPVGAALVPGERSPRAAQVMLPVRGAYSETDDRAAGLRLRRQVRQLMENTAWKQQGLPWLVGWDDEQAGWLAIGGGELTEEDRGWAFGDWQLKLDDAFLVGRPATHRRAVRFVARDRASAGVPIDSRGRIFSTFLSTAAGSPVAVLPAGVFEVTGYRGRIPAVAAGPIAAGLMQFTTAPATSGEVLSYDPHPNVIAADGAAAFATAEETGQVRVWRLPTLTPPDPATYTLAGDRAPEGYGWERVYGALDDPRARYAIDNGYCRIVQLGNGGGGGWRLERRDLTSGVYVPVARVSAFYDTTAIAAAVEITPERAVLQWRGVGRELRIVLQRGWAGPIAEAYAAPGVSAWLDFGGYGSSRTAGQPDRYGTGTGGPLEVAKTTDGITFGSGAMTGTYGAYYALEAISLPLDLSPPATPAPATFLTRARWDVRMAATLVPR